MLFLPAKVSFTIWKIHVDLEQKHDWFDEPDKGMAVVKELGEALYDYTSPFALRERGLSHLIPFIEKASKIFLPWYHRNHWVRLSGDILTTVKSLCCVPFAVVSGNCCRVFRCCWLPTCKPRQS